MKLIYFFALLWLSSCAEAKTTIYIGSTPADVVVREFLNISLNDSIDFIRWNINLEKETYLLSCNYGIGKQNTNGFINGGKQISLSGNLEKRSNYYVLHYRNRQLQLHSMNASLLHIADNNCKLLTGNAGWSYTLSIETASSSTIILPAASITIQDSAVYVGRTPCIPVIDKQTGNDCYKQKWKIVLYVNKSFELRGTLTDHKVKKGNYVMTKNREGKALYHLQYDDEHLYLQPLSTNLLAFTNNTGDLLVGNADFSYTLNRKE